MKKLSQNSLKKIEKYIATDITYITNGGFWLILSHLIQMVSGLVLAIAFANILSKTSYGLYQAIIAMGTILAGLTINMSIPTKKAVAQGNDGALRFGFLTQLKWSFGVFIISGIVSYYYFYNENLLIGKSILVIGLLSPLINSFSLYRSFLLGKKKFKENALFGFWLRPIIIGSTLVTLYFSKDPFILISVYFLTYTLVTGLLYLKTIRKYNLSYKTSVEDVNYGKHLSVIGIISNIGNHLEKLLIFHFLGAAQVAIYSIAMLPTTHIMKFYSSASELIMPKFAQRTYLSIREGMVDKILVTVTLLLLVVVLYIVFSPYIFNIIFPKYPEAIILSQIGSLLVLAKVGNLFTQAFYSHEMKRELYIVRITTIIIKISLLFILIPIYGILGAIIALLITGFLWAIISGMLFYIKNDNVKL